MIHETHHTDLTAIAECFGVNLRIEEDPTAPLRFGVWCEDPATGETELIGASNSAGEAIDEARQQLRKWTP
jgi:hypothetical protein